MDLVWLLPKWLRLSSWQPHRYRWACERLYSLKRWLMGVTNTGCNELQRCLGLFCWIVITSLKIPFTQVICWNTWYDQAIPPAAQTLYLQRIFDAALQVCQIRSMMKAICLVCCAESINGRNDLIVRSMPKWLNEALGSALKAAALLETICREEIGRCRNNCVGSFCF